MRENCTKLARVQFHVSNKAIIPICLPLLCSLDLTCELQTNTSCVHVLTWHRFMFSIQQADGDLFSDCVRRSISRREESGFLPDGYSRLWAGWWSRRFTREGLYPSSARESNRRASQQDSQAPPCCTGRRLEQSTSCTAVSFPLVLTGPAEMIVQRFYSSSITEYSLTDFIGTSRFTLTIHFI